MGESRKEQAPKESLTQGKKKGMSRHAHSEAMLDQARTGVELRRHPEESERAGQPWETASVQEIMETRSKDLLVEVRWSVEARGILSSAFENVIGESGSVRHLVSTTEVEIRDIDPTA